MVGFGQVMRQQFANQAGVIASVAHQPNISLGAGRKNTANHIACRATDGKIVGKTMGFDFILVLQRFQPGLFNLSIPLYFNFKGVRSKTRAK